MVLGMAIVVGGEMMMVLVFGWFGSVGFDGRGLILLQHIFIEQNKKTDFMN
jgi:hypothetical protein